MNEETLNKLLVIDDDPAIRKLLEKILQKKGFAVYTAQTGRAGLDLLKEHLSELSLVILDYTLLDMSCEEVCLEIDELGDRLGIIIMSGQDSNLIKETTALCPNIKASLYKPFTIDELMNSIKKTLNERESDE